MRSRSALLVVATSLVVACGSSSGDGNPTADPGTGGTTSLAGASATGGTSAGGKSGAAGAGTAGAAAGKGGGASGAAGKAGASGGAGPGGAAGKGAGGGAAGMSGGVGGGNPSDPFDKARQLCVDTINNYRATLMLPPYKRWTQNEACVDKEATGDGMAMMPHVSFKNHLCSPGFAQDECPNYGADPIAALPGCLDQMWAEKDRAVCKGCSTCDFPYQNCVSCTFFGTNGSDGCGHYLNMKSAAFSEVACGFWSGGWYAQDFQ